MWYIFNQLLNFFSNIFSYLVSNLYEFLFMLIYTNYINDASESWQIGFQDSASPGMTGIIELHNDIFFFLVLILLSVFWILSVVIFYYNNSNSPIVYKYWTHGTLIELI